MSKSEVTPENRQESGRDEYGRFRTGVSGNPGGRPQSIIAVIRERRPNVSADLVDFWTLVAFGSAAAIQKKYGVKPRMQDRLAAASELADRLHGRSIPTTEMIEPEIDVPTFIFPPGTRIAIE